MLTEAQRTSPGFLRGLALLRRLAAYHQYEAFGLDEILHIKTGAIVVLNHSLALYDAMLLQLAGYEASGRWVHPMADRLMFKLPGIGAAFSAMGFVEGSRETAIRLLLDGDVLGVLPGGMREALRSSRQKYTIDWTGRYGFVRMSLVSGTPIVLAACPRADDIFEVADSSLTRWAYDRFRLPLPFFHGRGPTPVPRPVKLWHVMSEPIFPPAGGMLDDDTVHAHHALLVERMQALMQRALDYPDSGPNSRFQAGNA